ncbi:RNA-directed DNA polymerase from mobile element jockey [Trichonephila clavipes]|nr:RNA-directed DNA polymerase from mobile element jockey [Trichonephila clavipes]
MKDIRQFFQSCWEYHIVATYAGDRQYLEETLPIQKIASKHFPTKDALGSVATHPLEKAELIADSLQKQFEPNTETENERFEAHTQRKTKISGRSYLSRPGENNSNEITQLLRATELNHHGFQNNQNPGIRFVDIAKSFDKMGHDGLISKMMRLGFMNQLIKIIYSYLNSSEFRARVENSLSSPLPPILSEIPLESLLEPKFFNLYINDIPKAVNVHLAMYADCAFPTKHL